MQHWCWGHPAVSDNSFHSFKHDCILDEISKRHRLFCIKHTEADVPVFLFFKHMQICDSKGGANWRLYLDSWRGACCVFSWFPDVFQHFSAFAEFHTVIWPSIHAVRYNKLQGLTLSHINIFWHTLQVVYQIWTFLRKNTVSETYIYSRHFGLVWNCFSVGGLLGKYFKTGTHPLSFYWLRKQKLHQPGHFHSILFLP